MLVNFRKNFEDYMNETETMSNEIIQSMTENTNRIIKNSFADKLADKAMVHLEKDLKLEIDENKREILKVMLRDDIDSAFDDLSFVINYHSLKDRHLK